MKPIINFTDRHKNIAPKNDLIESSIKSSTNNGKLFWVLRIVITLCAAYGWWGVLYPEFTMTPDTYRVVYEDSSVQENGEVVEYKFDDSIYETILKSDCSRIRFRSRLLVNLTALKEQESDIHDAGKRQ